MILNKYNIIIMKLNTFKEEADKSRKRNSYASVHNAVFLIALLFVLLITLCACNFDAASLIGAVTLDVETAYERENGVNFLILGEENIFTVGWENEFVISPEIKWYIKTGDDVSIIEDQTDTALKLVFKQFDDKRHIIYATANGRKSSEEFDFYLKYASLSSFDFTSSSGKIADGHFQQNIMIPENVPESITFGAEWENEYLNPAVGYEFEWKLMMNEERLKEFRGESFCFDTEIVAEPATYYLKCKIAGSDGGSVEQTLILEFISAYIPVSKISVKPLNGLAENEGFYLQTAYDGADFSDVEFCVSALPETGTNLSVETVWTLRNGNGTFVLDEDGRTVELSPAYGKNVLSAAIENVESRSFTFYVLSESDLSNSVVRSALAENFIWDGSLRDGYLMDSTDVGYIVNYMISKHNTASDYSGDNVYNTYLQPSAWKNGNATTGAFETVVQRSVGAVDESGSFSVSFGISFMFLTEGKNNFGYPLLPYPTEYDVAQAPQNNYYSVNFDLPNAPSGTLPIDNVNETLTVYNSNDLYRAAGWGYRPVFENNDGGKTLSALYSRARGVLNSICDDNMTEFEKARAIYQWICGEVEYDYGAAYDNSENLEVRINYNAFYLEGVFEDYRAVCDGKSKAFVLLCGMEGIKSVRITGKINSSDIGHAWNKALIDADGDGIREWYVVDTTWGDKGTAGNNNGFKVTEFTSYAYFLISDNDIKDTHFSQQTQPVADTEFNAYKANTFEFEGKIYDAHIQSYDELLAVAAYLAQEKPMAMDIEIEIAGINGADSLKDIIYDLMLEKYFACPPFEIKFFNSKEKTCIIYMHS